MQTLEDFEKWVENQGGPGVLAEKIKGRFGKKIEISQSAISNWIGRRRVSKDKRQIIEEMGWVGPMEWPEVTEKLPDYLTREAFAEWRGRILRLEEDIRALLPLTLAVKDLKQQVEQLSRARGPQG